MKLIQLRYLVALADEAGVAAAAARLGIARNTLLRSLRALEQELGMPLFERGTAQLILTAPGRLFVARVSAALAQLDQAADIVRKGEQPGIGS